MHMISASGATIRSSNGSAVNLITSATIIQLPCEKVVLNPPPNILQPSIDPTAETSKAPWAASRTSVPEPVARAPSP